MACGLALGGCTPPTANGEPARAIAPSATEWPNVSEPLVREGLLAIVKDASTTDVCMTLVVRSDGVAEARSAALERLFPELRFFRITPSYGHHPPNTECAYPSADSFAFSAAIDRKSGRAQRYGCVSETAPFAALASSAGIAIHTLDEVESFWRAFVASCGELGSKKGVHEEVSAHSWRVGIFDLEKGRSFYELTTDERGVVKTFGPRSEAAGH